MLDTTRLQNIQHRNGIIVAQCPACADEGGDRKGEHLFIGQDGRFGCVLYPEKSSQPEAARAHRKRIFEFIGIKQHAGPEKEGPTNTLINIKVKVAKRSGTPEVIEKDVLGRLGRFKSSHLKLRNPTQTEPKKPETGIATGVPSVPDITERSDYDYYEV